MSNLIRYFIAVFLIGVGVMLVLANFGFVDFGFGTIWHHLYPVLILAIGIKWLYDYLRKWGTHWFLGLFFIVFGGLLILDRFEVLTFYFKDIFKLWPLLIIYFGFLLIGIERGQNGNFVFTFEDDDEKKSQYVKKQNFTVGSQDYSQPNWKVEPMNINTFAGDFYLDFTKAFIPEKETPISIRSLAGDVHILMPENVEFRIEAHVKAGEIDILGNDWAGVNRSYKYETEGYEAAVSKIDLFIKLKAGSIRVDHV
ncbi:cell wall-active antibiotics response protein LiaF [Oceanobacillus luteolus]|uniref:Cell wall-active antibiotics response protein LiaF n=1 Tax=Oceanobacillus luteolus TaxID=1274358 RepID=A0ABW4HR67_9BACI|nr:cell wall-active antibiotics response protein LiaF [Oceanobacillus luteolus]MCM3739566.1 cell wall-active antibiotics response protein LiaF [Oceanobacillus luteolus]